MYCSSIWIPIVLGIIVGVACLAGLGYTLCELSKTKEIYSRYLDIEEVARGEAAAITEDAAGVEAATEVVAAAIWKFLTCIVCGCKKMDFYGNFIILTLFGESLGTQIFEFKLNFLHLLTHFISNTPVDRCTVNKAIFTVLPTLAHLLLHSSFIYRAPNARPSVALHYLGLLCSQPFTVPWFTVLPTLTHLLLHSAFVYCAPSSLPYVASVAIPFLPLCALSFQIEYIQFLECSSSD
ncbi:hypothetical protein TIFTF001_033067 [Ficus carica]|uniref:Uncharacterized protein n=1 Tax=Ficus carica TaxID=3494 RepID=A0AA88J8Q0_FICCA|nr:hypothetical protein TIFTF001_033067 [Ficus carica]